MKTKDQILADRQDDLIGVTGGQAAQIKHYYEIIQSKRCETTWKN